MRTGILLLLLLVLAAAGCTEQKQDEPETNVIKDYVNTPKERAMGARSAVEGAQDRAAREADAAREDEGEEEESE